MKVEDFPCYQCICIPICRHKPVVYLILDCKLIKDHACKLIDNLRIFSSHIQYTDYVWKNIF